MTGLGLCPDLLRQESVFKAQQDDLFSGLSSYVC